MTISNVTVPNNITLNKTTIIKSTVENNQNINTNSF